MKGAARRTVASTRESEVDTIFEPIILASASSPSEQCWHFPAPPRFVKATVKILLTSSADLRPTFVPRIPEHGLPDFANATGHQ